jgi:hypothetical protein
MKETEKENQSCKNGNERRDEAIGEVSVIRARVAKERAELRSMRERFRRDLNLEPGANTPPSI